MKRLFLLFFLATFSFNGIAQCVKLYITDHISGSPICNLTEGDYIEICEEKNEVNGCPRNLYIYDKGSSLGSLTYNLSLDRGWTTHYAKLSVNTTTKRLGFEIQGQIGIYSYSTKPISEEEKNRKLQAQIQREEEREKQEKEEKEKQLESEKQKQAEYNLLIETVKKSINNDSSLIRRIYYSIDDIDSIGYYDIVGVGRMSYNAAKSGCTELGNGWRLPTINELKIISLNRSDYGVITENSNGVWSLNQTGSRIDTNWAVCFSVDDVGKVSNSGGTMTGENWLMKKYESFVIAIRPEEFKTINNLQVMNKDLGKLNYKDAFRIAEELGGGWRLPTIDELKMLYGNQLEFGGFINDLYWSSSSNEYGTKIFAFNFGKGKQKDFWSNILYELNVRLVREM